MVPGGALRNAVDQESAKCHCEQQPQANAWGRKSLKPPVCESAQSFSTDAHSDHPCSNGDPPHYQKDQWKPGTWRGNDQSNSQYQSYENREINSPVRVHHSFHRLQESLRRVDSPCCEHAKRHSRYQDSDLRNSNNHSSMASLCPLWAATVIRCWSQERIWKAAIYPFRSVKTKRQSTIDHLDNKAKHC